MEKICNNFYIIGSYIDGVDDLWRWMRDEGDGGEERMSLLFLQLIVLH